MDKINPYLFSANEVLIEFGTEPAEGLSNDRVAESRAKYGSNTLARQKPDSFIMRVLKGCTEPMVIMLIIAGLITFGVNIARALTGGETDFLECIGVFAAIILSVMITVVMEGRSAKAFEALSKITDDTEVRVIRNGLPKMIHTRDLVVGDIICVETGDKVPADARLISSVSLMSDESALTGESVPVSKNAEFVCANSKTPIAERYNMLYSGCFITGGSGRAIVTSVGGRTEFGKIAGELSNGEKSATPLQEKMARLGKRIALLGSAAAVIVFIFRLVTLISTNTASIETISDAFITSIILIVAAVPEGLPTIMAISLAINAVKMSKQNALVKKMIACETAGCVNVICSDKTGTLTENKMTVIQVIASDKTYAPSEITDDILIGNFCLNSTADISGGSFIGNPTECALLTAAKKSGFDYKMLRGNTNIIHTFPFSSETKNMTTICSDSEGLTAYTKGSPEKILSMCLMPDSIRRRIETQIEEYQAKACRVLAFAHKNIEGISDFDSDRGSIESAMEFDGFAAITDPLREEVFDAVEKCRDAGIELKILTGDNIVTARAIAKELGILSNGEAVEATYIDGLSDSELLREVPKIRVIARSTPTIKMRVVKALKELGSVVAVTGDGINDAPAIKNADIGIAMGISGTEVSKEASDIVLLDDSFGTIVKSVKWGRGIYENFKRFIQFQLTVNFSSVLTVLCSVFAGLAAPFTAIQLLWINIIMDGPPALTLGLEPVNDDLMKRKPTKRNESIVTKTMLIRIALSGIIMTALVMAQSLLNFLGAPDGQQSSVIFTLFVLMQLFNAFACRRLGSSKPQIMANKPMLAVFAFVFVLQIVITQFCGAFFDTVPLPFIMWLKLTALAFAAIIVSELIGTAVRAICDK